MNSSNQNEKDLQQNELNNDTYDLFLEKGCENNLNSKFLYEISKIAINNNNSKLISIQPNIKKMDKKVWNQSLCFIISYLRRYKMEKTLQTIKLEYPQIPKSTGFVRASDIDNFFHSIKKTALIVSDQTFDEKIIEFKSENM